MIFLPNFLDLKSTVDYIIPHIKLLPRMIPNILVGIIASISVVRF
jgi:hypothetical protein